MASTEESLLGARLDEHHLPETNGRMAVCRRCGIRTDGPDGRRHLPQKAQLARSNEWLVAQSRKVQIRSLHQAGDR